MSDLLQRARIEGTPLIDGTSATFVWQGQREPQLIGDLTRWSPVETARSGLQFQRVEPNLWTLTVTPEPDAYLEYALLVGGLRTLDPLNSRETPNGFGDVNNYFHMPEAPHSALFRRQRGVPRGKVTRYVLESRYLAGGRRAIRHYRPASSGPASVLLVLDGSDYAGRVQMPALLDNLIAMGTLPPLHVIFLDNAGPSRIVEYGCSEGLTNFIELDLWPWLAQRVDLSTQAGSHAVLGASMGGLAALWIGMRLSHRFGRVFSQAGAFSIGVGEMALTELVRRGERRRLRIYLDIGTYDFLYEGNQMMRQLLADRGYVLKYNEMHAGHNYPAWREDLAAGLEWLFATGGSR